MNGCRERYVSTCSMLMKRWNFVPPVVEMTLTQMRTELSGTSLIDSLITIPISGFVTQDGGFFVWGSTTTSGGVRNMSGRFARNADGQLDAKVIVEWRSGERLDTTYLLEGAVLRQR